ncbi:MAG: hypothetical protein EBS71_08530 [Actinobacteria bacterium]|nr:hypothetical protein [Actinomycetota bacterium]
MERVIDFSFAPEIEDVRMRVRDFMDKQVRYENIEVVESLLANLKTDVEGLNEAHLQRLDALLAHQRDSQERSGQAVEEVTKAAVGLSEAAVRFAWKLS